MSASGATTPDDGTNNSRSLRSRFMLGADLSLSSRPPSPELAATPNFEELRRSLSSKALRELDTNRLRAGVWRPPNEEPRHPRSLEQLYLHAALTAFRAGGLAWGTRAAFNLLFVLVRALTTRRLRFAAIQGALLSKSATNFGRVFAIFAFAWKFVKEGLRLYNIGPRGKMQQERWHAALAGALAGLCVLGEGERSRTSLAQQIFVRGLQGIANRLHAQGLRIPHANVLVFGASCSMIMGCFGVAGQALDPGYRNWILKASQGEKNLLPVQHARSNGKPLPVEYVERVLAKSYVTPRNASRLRDWLESSKRGDHGAPFAMCELHHPDYDSCLKFTALLWPRVFRWIMPVYIALNTIPSMVLRRKAWMNRPLDQMLKALRNTAYNCAFLATFVVLYSGPFCWMRNTWHNPSFSLWVRRQVTSHKAYFFIGSLTSLSLFFEDARRRTELAIYVLPKALEAAWRLLRQRRLVPQIKDGPVLLGMAGSAMLMDTWEFDRDNLSGLAKAILYQVLGP